MSWDAGACTCFGTASIGSAMTEAEVVVLGEALGKREPPTGLGLDGAPFANADAIAIPLGTVAFKVLETLKGSAAGEILVGTRFSCYQSFSVDDFDVGEKYVLALDRVEAGMHMLPDCSHTALEVLDGKLYTNELTKDGMRLERYMGLGLLELLLPTGLLHTRMQIIAGSILVLLTTIVLPARWRRRAAPDQSAPVRPFDAMRSLRIRSITATAGMLLLSVMSVLCAIAWLDWSLWVLAALFAVATVGLALRWTWTEGLAYGLMIIVVGACLVLLYDLLEWQRAMASPELRAPRAGLAVLLGIVAAAVWIADSVRRRFSPPAPPASTGAPAG